MEILLREARTFILENQLLRGPSIHTRVDGALDVIEQLGYLQIDTISVVSRAHHHVLWSRVKNYKEAHLKKLEKEQKIFEYWAHAASYLPIRDYKYSLYPKAKARGAKGHWGTRDRKWMKRVYEHIKGSGPTMSKDFKKDSKLNFDHAWGGHPIKLALMQLFIEGDIMIVGRKGFQKIYDITERSLPQEVDISMPTEEEYYKYLIRRDLKAQGILKASEIGHLINIPKKKLGLILNELIEDKEVIELTVRGLSDLPYYAMDSKIHNQCHTRRNKRLHILSPFDNLIIQRKRLKEIFNFDYLLECYVPALKRKVGYYSLPLLWGNGFVGQIDLKAHRKEGQLEIKNLVWATKNKKSERLIYSLQSELEKYALFNGCVSVIGAIG